MWRVFKVLNVDKFLQNFQVETLVKASSLFTFYGKESSFYDLVAVSVPLWLSMTVKPVFFYLGSNITI